MRLLLLALSTVAALSMVVRMCQYQSTAAAAAAQQQQQQQQQRRRSDSCYLFEGEWVYDASYPLYELRSCPMAEAGFRCRDNGRRDEAYSKWRWKPQGCSLPRFEASEALERLRGKRVTFVGDSMGRTQWESLICMLAVSQSQSRLQPALREVRDRAITKRAPHLAVHFAQHNLTIDYYRSPFLVQQSHHPLPRRAPKRVTSVLHLDRLDAMEQHWRTADVLVFNSGHWWNPSKTFKAGCYFAIANSLRLSLKLETAYLRALTSWASWVDSKLDHSRTRVFFRSYEPSHWLSPKACLSPSSSLSSRLRLQQQQQQQRLGFAAAVDRVLRSMASPASLLNITALTDLRSDGHVGNWSLGGVPPLDCSHWCLPGVPDTWNELLFALL